MRSYDHLQVVVPQKIDHRIHPESVADSSLVLLPASREWLWVRPEQINRNALVGDLQWPRYFVELLQMLQVGA
jgi:hypothetical protein